MADEEEQANALPDVPKSTAIVKTREDAVALARETTGRLPPNKCLFYCISCGWKGTLEFDEDEMAALGGDVKSYGGPCPGEACGTMTLVSEDKLLGDEFKPIREQARENRREDIRDAANIVVEVVKDEVGGIMSGSTLDKAPEERLAEERPPGQHEDLPETGEADLEGLKGRPAEE